MNSLASSNYLNDRPAAEAENIIGKPIGSTWEERYLEANGTACPYNSVAMILLPLLDGWEGLKSENICIQYNVHVK